MGSTPGTGSYVLCPVCHKPNPEGTKFCHHCWGAIIPVGSPLLSSQEVETWLSRLKRRKIIKVITTSLVALIVLVAVIYPTLYFTTDIVMKPSPGLNSNSLPGEWAMFRYDLGHSGAAAASSILPQGRLKWVFATDSTIHSSPVVADGTVYIGARNNKLYALDAATGSPRWEYQTGSWVESSPAIAGGMVYFGSNDGRLYALDADSGEKLWDFPTKYAVMSSPAVAGGIVYFGADDYYLYALDATEGTKLWAFNTQGLVKSSPVVANGIVYVGSNSNFGYALNALNGSLRLRFQTHYPVSSSPAVSDGIVYFSTTNGYLFAVDGNARTWPREHAIKPYWVQLWLMGVPLVPVPPPQSGFLWGLTLDKIATFSPVVIIATSSPVVADDTLYIAANDTLLAIDLRSQQKRWEFKTDGAIRDSPAVADSVVYATSENGQLYALNAATGEKLWDIAIGSQLTSSPAVVDGIIYVGSQDGKLYAIE